MAQKLNGGMADLLDLDAQYTIRFAALSPTTGAPVAGVNISLAEIHFRQVQGTPADLVPPDVEPLWLNLPQDVPGG